MVVLKKIKASTLMETMVATVLIVVVFMIASMLLDTIFYNNINNNTQAITEKFNELEYKYTNKLINTPYFEEWNAWDIEMLVENKKGANYIILQGEHTKTKKKVTTIITEND